MIYSVVINPLERLMHWLFSLFLFYTDSAAISLILVSFTISLIIALILKKNRDLESLNSVKRCRISNALHGISGVTNKREKYYYTREIYRIHGYRQWEALANLLPVVIQVPFFLAAYYAFSASEALAGGTFAGLFELGSPDGIIFGINALPIVMTIINILGILVSRDKRSNAEIVQSIILAVVFLALLYSQPSGLVLYWIFNNIFAIVRDLHLNKTGHSGAKLGGTRASRLFIFKRLRALFFRHVDILLSLYLLICAMFVTAYHFSNKTSRIASLLLFMSLLSVWSFLVMVLQRILPKRDESSNVNPKASVGDFPVRKEILSVFGAWSSFLFFLYLQQAHSFWSGKSGSLILVGLFLVALYASRTQVKNAIIPPSIKGEAGYSYRTVASVIGLFFITVFFVVLKIYLLNISDFQSYTYAVIAPLVFEFSVLVLVVLALAQYFSTSRAVVLFAFSVLSTLSLLYGSIGGSQVFKNFMLEDVSMITRGSIETIAEIFIILSIVLIEWYLLVVLRSTVVKKEKLIKTIAFSLSLVMALNLAFIVIKHGSELIEVNTALKESDALTSRFKLTKKNNTIVLLLDGFPGNLMSTLLEEKPELLDEFTGFTWFPDAISLGAWTWNGAPAIYGGNAYSPERLIDSKGKLVYAVLDDTVKRHVGKGRSVQFYREPFFKSTHKDDRFSKHDFVELKKMQAAKTHRNMLLNIAFFQLSPLFLKAGIYNEGSWTLSGGPHDGDEVDVDALDRYEFLLAMPSIDKNLLDDDVVISYVYANISHGPYSILEDGSLSKQFLGDYWHAEGQTYSAVFALRQVASLLANIKAMGLYDSSQIVVVSDHGNPGIEKMMTWDARGLLPELGTKAGWYDCLLMYKAPNATGSIKIDFDKFMTNADVPDLIEAGLAGEIDKYFYNLRPDRTLRHYVQYNNVHEKEITVIEMQGTSLDTSVWSVEYITNGE